jgi:CRISPR-associated protein Cas2
MLVMIVEKLPQSLRGALSRWLMEVRPGIFLGSPSQRIRDELWKKVTQRPPLGYVLQMWSSPTPQGFDYRQYGESNRALADFEGIALVTVKRDTKKRGKSGQMPRDSS